MTRLISGLILAATVLSGTDLTVCASGCTYNNSQLQTALAAATCGDTVTLEAGVTYSGTFAYHGTTCGGGSPIIVRGSKYLWMPGVYSRVTPSHLSNYPVLAPTVLGQLSLYGQFDGSRNPPNNWQFQGLAFTTGTLTGHFSGTVLGTVGARYPSGTDTDRIQNINELPDGIVFDRCLFLGPIDNSLEIQTMLRLNTKSGTIKNSFFRDMLDASFEGHAVGVFTGVGPITLTNNYMDATGIPFFTGGTTPDYLPATPANLSIKYNYFTKQLKWWPNQWNGSGWCPTPGVSGCVTTDNPHGQYYIDGGKKSGCIKNLLEFKIGTGLLIQYNTFENAWNTNPCEGQKFGVTMTIRTQKRSNTDGDFPGNQFGTLSCTGVNCTWNGTLNQDPASHDPDHTFQNPQGVFVFFAGPKTWEYRTIVSANMNAKTIVLDAAFTLGAVTNSNWSVIVNPYAELSDYTLRDNVFRTVVSPFHHLGRDPSNTTDATNARGRIKDLTVLNNLVINTYASNDSFTSWDFTQAEHPPYGDSYPSAINYIYQNNTLFSTNRPHTVMSYSYCNQVDPTIPLSACAKANGFVMNSNIFREAYVQPDTNQYNILTDGNCGSSDVGCAIDKFTVAAGTISFKGNVFPTVSCAAGTYSFCAGNDTGAYNVQYYTGTYKLKATSQGYKGGVDGSDAGTNYDKLALIRNVRVTTSDKTALLEFDLTGPVKDAGGVQPCVLEVSISENLWSDTGTYGTINALNPAYFKQADASNTANPLLLAPVVSSGHVSWPLGRVAIVTGDGGNSHDMRLGISTAHYARVMCYGDTQTVGFSTLAVSSGATTRTYRWRPASPADSVVLDYGATASLGSSTTASVSGGSASATISVTAGQHLYSRATYKQGGTVLFVGPVQISLP